eukprot:6078010-Karenia_brevis.AAC.1
MTQEQPDSQSKNESGHPKEHAQPSMTVDCTHSNTILVPLSSSARRICIMEANSLPMAFSGDGKSVGCLYQKYYCERCNVMPLRDGQWFLIDKAARRMIWICAVCGGPFNDKCCPFLLGIKTGIDPGDIVFVKAAGPDYVE